ncbi:2-keto-4-pentenoate hydratase [Quisquiliibacterium transsilvanicum]|uniref:2-keto-4-pentenoate hydratase n=1 Tax=Quisquiliibacterium transsilvanicum TaxID=1549638 RepID=A0A7W8HIY8_9BURK|nr:fumarylacetoacetate hydrolase family protein [Quisquiliibacterium transsilvanicum]MBB5272934.1 2-keto-4-pentenoate hydratase [Quisquiliibacterium transsilvanicum]
MTTGADAARLSDAEIEDLASRLVEARETRVAVALPPEFAQRCDAEAAGRLAVRHLRGLLARTGGRVVGSKLGGTNRAALEKLGLERPFVGPVNSAALFDSPARLPRAGFLMCVIEAEVAIRFGKPVDGRSGPPSREALVGAISELCPAIEIADSRLAGFPALPPAAIIADLGFAGALVTGAPCADWRRHDLSDASVQLTVNGVSVREGRGEAVLGNPLDALADYVADAGRAGRAIEAGEIVSTGTWTQPYMAQQGDLIRADFGPLGIVEVQIT